MIPIKAPELLKASLWSFISVCFSLSLSSTTASHALAAPVVIAQKGGQVKVPAFQVNVTLTEKARRKLETAKETIIVSVAVTGEPQKNSSITPNETGSINLVEQQIELPGSGRAQFDQLSISKAKLNQLVNQDYTVNVNVFSGRRSSQDNLLSCDFFDDKISKIQPGITLKCGLIGEYTSQLINSSSSSDLQSPSRSPNAVPALW